MLAITIPLAILSLIIYSYWILNKCSHAFPFAIIFIIEIAWGTLSIIWIDSGIYITEQLRVSYTTGAGLRYILLMLPFGIVFPKVLEYKIQHKKYITVKLKFSKVPIENTIWSVCIIVVVYILVDLLISGIPLLSSTVNKIGYYSKVSKLPLAGMLHTLVMPFAMLFSGIQFVQNPPKSRKFYEAIVVAALIIFIQILMDNKFYGLYDYVIWFVIPIAGVYINKRVTMGRAIKIPVKYVIIALAILGGLLAICYNQYSRISTNPFALLLNRIFSLQSHTFWGIDLLVQENQIGCDLDRVLKEILAGISGVPLTDADYGIGRVMYLVTKSTYADDMLRSGVLFAGSFLTVSLSYAGYMLTFIYSFVIGYIAACICAALYTYINGKDVVMLFFWFLLYRRIYEYFRVGSLSIIINWKMIVLLILLLGISKITCKRRV